MKTTSPLVKYALTTAIVLIAVLAVVWRYGVYLTNPWTRDGQVRANVIQVAPRVSGPIVELPIRDNQPVSAGDLLFRIDPRTFDAALAQASAQLDETRDQLQNLQAQVEAAEAAVEQAESQVPQAQSAVDSAEATLDKSRKDFERAESLIAKGGVAKRTYDEAKAGLDVAQANLAKARAQRIQADAALMQAKAGLARAKAQLGAPGEDNAQLRAAKAALETAKLNLEFTEVRASVAGFVTNLNLRLGSQAVANQPAMALVDAGSFWVTGFFRENLIADVAAGDRAVVTLMSYPARPLTGRVDSIGWGISQGDGSTGYDLLPKVSPTFQWIRLAQRIPVRIQLDPVPDGVELRVGTTASVLVMTGEDDGEAEVVPVPKALHSQGSHNQATAARPFLFQALAQLGIGHAQDTPDDALGRLLAEALAAAPSVLVLDGMEPLQQSAPGDQRLHGTIKDRGLATLLETLSIQPGEAICLASSRLLVPDSGLARAPWFRAQTLPGLDPAGALALLTRRGCKGTELELARLAQQEGATAALIRAETRIRTVGQWCLWPALTAIAAELGLPTPEMG